MFFREHCRSAHIHVICSNRILGCLTRFTMPRGRRRRVIPPTITEQLYDDITLPPSSPRAETPPPSVSAITVSADRPDSDTPITDPVYSQTDQMVILSNSIATLSSVVDSILTRISTTRPQPTDTISAPSVTVNSVLPSPDGGFVQFLKELYAERTASTNIQTAAHIIPLSSGLEPARRTATASPTPGTSTDVRPTQALFPAPDTSLTQQASASASPALPVLMDADRGRPTGRPEASDNDRPCYGVADQRSATHTTVVPPTPDTTKAQRVEEAEGLFAFDINRRTGKALKTPGKFYQLRPFMTLPTHVLASLETRPALDLLSPIEYVLGSLNMIDELKLKGFDISPYEAHLREVMMDASLYTWEGVRTWSNEIFQQLENKRITWDSPMVQRERARASWAKSLPPATHEPPVPCPVYNSYSDNVQCDLISGHILNGIKQIHTCMICFHVKGLHKSQHTAKNCFSRKTDNKSDNAFKKRDRSRSPNRSDNRPWPKKFHNNNSNNTNNNNKQQQKPKN